MAIFCNPCYDKAGLVDQDTFMSADWNRGGAPTCIDCGEVSCSTMFYNVPEGCLLVWDDVLLYRYHGDRDVETVYDKELWECKSCDAVFAHRDIKRRYGGTLCKPEDYVSKDGFVFCECPECGKMMPDRVKAPEGCLAVTEGEIL